MALFALNLTRWLRIYYRRKWIIISIFLIVFISTIYFTNRLTPIYSAKATVSIARPKDVGMSMVQGGTGFGFNVKREISFIRSPQVMEEVVKRLGLAPEWATLEEFKNFGRSLAVRIKTKRTSKKSNIVEISIKASRPKEAAELVNAVAQAYVEVSLKERTRRIRSFRQSIEKELNIAKAKLDESEKALTDFGSREGDILREIEIVEARLAALKFELSELLQTYYAENDMVKVVKERIEVTQNQFKVLVNKELEFKHLTRTFNYNLGKYNEWKKDATSIRITEEVKIPYVSIVNTATVPNFPIWPNKLLNGFMGIVIGLIIGVSLTFYMENLETALTTIEDVESFMELPVLGVIPYLARKEKKETKGLLTFTKRRDKLSCLRKQLVIHNSPQSPASESYRSLRTSIQSAVLEKGAKALLVTSTGPSEGKSITATNLAITATQAGHKVLLVDADLRRPILHKLFDLKKRPGLTDCLTGTAKWQDTLHTIVDILVAIPEWEELLRVPGLDNLKIITCGNLPLNPSELLDSEKMKSLVEEVRRDFDLILFDSPPVLPVPDATILGTKLDGVILVYQTGIVVGAALRRAKIQLEGAGASVKGIVLNNTTREVEAYLP